MSDTTALTPVSMDSSSPWDDLDWVYGQMFMMGFDGTEVTPQIRQLIEVHHLGTILLAPKNLRCNALPLSRVSVMLTSIPSRRANHQACSTLADYRS